MSRTLIPATLVIAAAVMAAAAAPKPTTEAERGREIFMSVGCWQCHGTVGQGGGAGPRLAPNPLPAATVLATVRKPIKEMPPYNRRVLSDDDVAAIHAYLTSVKPPPSVDSLEKYFSGGSRPKR
jgi:ubiquinol-cytochrome c reductase cytochrome c subunit